MDLKYVKIYGFLIIIEVLDIKFADHSGIGAKKLSDAINNGWLKNLKELHIPGIPKTSLFDHIYNALV